MLTRFGWIDVKWFDRAHLAALQHVHAVCFPAENWRKSDFARFADRPGRIVKAVVKEDGGKVEVVGTLLYRLREDEVSIARLAVLPEYRRAQIGSHALRTLTGPNSPNRRKRYVARVREDNLPVQCLLRDLGFLCDDIVRERYPADAAGRSQDAFQFTYIKPDPAARRKRLAVAEAVMP